MRAALVRCRGCRHGSAHAKAPCCAVPLADACRVPMPRLFTGLEVPREIADLLATQRGGLPGARWIDPENYHVTLRFIGDIDDALARDIAAMLGQIKRRGFELRFDRLSSFGGRRPRAVI